MKQKLLSLLIVLALCLTLIPGALAWDGETDWQDAYRAFLLEEGFRKTGRTYSDSADYPIRFSLYDLDGDFRPELLLRDPMRAMAQEPYDVYTVREGAVEAWAAQQSEGLAGEIWPLPFDICSETEAKAAVMQVKKACGR